MKDFFRKYRNETIVGLIVLLFLVSKDFLRVLLN
ncbi:MAG: hypothetical protein RL161_901 [Bacteroidota bacterium]|jgi:hypothetical protein